MNDYDSSRPASETSPWSGSNSEPKLKATLTFEGSPYEVKTAIFEQAQEMGRLNENVSSLNQKVSDLNSKIYEAEDEARRERRRAERAEEDLRESRRNHQVLLNRESVANDRYHVVAKERDKLRTENERLRAALTALAGGEDAAKKALEDVPEPVPQTASSERDGGNSVTTVHYYGAHNSYSLETLYAEIPAASFTKFVENLQGLQKPDTAAGFGEFLRGVCHLIRPEDGKPITKIHCIKRLREATGLGLKEAKDLVEYTG